ncbi:MAG: cysteine--tRNA ligase [Planctomycetota bacterium]
MSIRIHDTLSRETHPFEPLEPGKVSMYLCGPTVYSDCHIGHLMGPVVFDTIARWFEARGFRVQLVVNITDIDDKIIHKAQATGQAWNQVSEHYTEQYWNFLRELGVQSITDSPHCTHYVDAMVRFIGELIEKGRAYPAADGVYFRVLQQPGYGKLSGRRLEDMQAGARVETQAGLEHPADFVLWKNAKPGEPSWPSPWGDGRPGWHIECSVMSSAIMGPVFDIHGGGDDLKFPHHENEIAQSEAHGDRFARLWMHHGLVQYGGRKIGKSDTRMQDAEFARQFNARYLLDTYGAPAVRFFLVRSPYRRPVDFEPSALDSARTGLVRLYRQLGERMDAPGPVDAAEVLARPVGEAASQLRREFAEAMDEDFNTGEAIAALFRLAALANGQEGGEQDQTLLLMRDLGRVLGLFQPGDLQAVEHAGLDSQGELAELVGQVLAARGEARAQKDWGRADKLRDALTAAGIAVLDGAAGTSFERVPGHQGDPIPVLRAALEG